MQIVAADIGGTNARFALAEVADGRVLRLGDPVTLATDDHASLETAWAAFAASQTAPLPRAAALAVASPIRGDVIKFTNNPWVIHPASLDARLGLDRHLLVNDFGAVAHAVAQADPAHFQHLAGPDRPLPDAGAITVCGPGTGLGVAQLLLRSGGYQVLETEGGHMDWAPLDTLEDDILRRLRRQFTRVSAERIVSGPGLAVLYGAMAGIEGRAIAPPDDELPIWQAAQAGTDPLAVAALDRFFLALGAVAGDLALAHGARAVVIAGGLGYRLRDRFAASGFAERFVAKGRFRDFMATLPVKLITHPQAGLFGAAAAFAQADPERQP